ncbi:MAG: peptide deformylase [Fimbriimonadales bacterium]|nr:peptide deformylase [Fimbriimonadales bacterium]
MSKVKPVEIQIPNEFRIYFERDDGVVKYPDPFLRKVAKPVQRITPDIHELIDHMMRVMKRAKGVGIAAPQVGVPLRLIIVAPEDQPARVIINPQVLERAGEQVGLEGCLSIPQLFGYVKRAQHIVVRGINRHGKPIRLTLEGDPARITLHEIDHLEGVLFIDRAQFDTLYWEHPQQNQEEEII